MLTFCLLVFCFVLFQMRGEDFKILLVLLMFSFLHKIFVFRVYIYPWVLCGRTLHTRHYTLTSPPLLWHESCFLRTNLMLPPLRGLPGSLWVSPNLPLAGAHVILTRATQWSSLGSWYGIMESSSLMALMVEVMCTTPVTRIFMLTSHFI